MIKIPAIRISSLPAPSAETDSLYLTHPKASLPASLAQELVTPRLAKTGAITGERGSKLVFHGKRTVVVMGMGEVATFTHQEAAEWGENAGRALLGAEVTSVQVVFPDDLRDPDLIINFVKGLCLANFNLVEFKTASKKPAVELKEIQLFGKAISGLGKDTWERLRTIVEGILFARELVELPSGTADPSGIVARFKKAVDLKKVQLEVWDEKKIDAKKMGLIQAVSKGSGTPPRFLVARIKARKKGAPTLALVGKGVTFDTGGVNLKVVAWKELIEMKKDMGGAAGVLGAMVALSKLRPDINVIGITPLTTNQLGSQSINPGDVFTSMAGKTVEIQNTDAEGRLILADAMHFALTQKVDYIVDAATLTGACCIALGNHYTGLFSNHQRLADTVKRAAEISGEPTWQLPTSPRYKAELKSAVADLSNMGKGRDGGASIGAVFIEAFVGETPWVHLDIASTVDLGEPASAGSQFRGAGRMVHTFVNVAEELSRQI
jgi:leucyl aminopeptidase